MKIRPKVRKQLEANPTGRSLDERIAALALFEDIQTDPDQIDLLAALRYLAAGGEIR